MFPVYFKLGLEHITDIRGYDHILFIITVCAIYTLKDYKKITLLVTAFTVGHSITLALASLGIVPTNSYWIELLIPVTIFITGILNIFTKFDFKIHFILVVLFGLIHGLGFSNFLQAILSENSSILLPLFSFNVGLEAGQLIIVFLAMLLNFIYNKLLIDKQVYWKNSVSILALVLSLLMFIERI